MSKNWRIALIGAEEPLGTAFVAACEGMVLPIAGILPVALQETDQSITYQGEEVLCQEADLVDWQGVDVVVMATGSAQARKLGDRLAREGRIVFWCVQPVPDADSIVSVQEATATALLRCLKPIHAFSPLQGISGFIGLPMAARGEAAIDELANQTRGLFAMEPVEPEVFPVPISFNIIPHVADSQADARAPSEKLVQAALRATLGEDLSVQILAAWVPTFFGAVAVVHGRCASPLDALAMREALQQAPGVLVMDSPLPGGVPTPATDAQESADVFVGRIQVDQEAPDCFSLWLTFDYPRLQAAQILAVLEKFFESASK